KLLVRAKEEQLRSFSPASSPWRACNIKKPHRASGWEKDRACPRLERGGEHLDRTPFAKGDIAIAGKRTFIVSGTRSLFGYMHPGPLAHVLEQGADIVVRAGWKGARSFNEKGKPFDILAALAAEFDCLDVPA